MTILLGAIADDFTGASDLANTLTCAGMATTLLVGVPSDDVPQTEAVVIALKTRSVPACEAVDRSLLALDWLKRRGAEQVLFKYCSTFDSTPEGNIGPVADALLAATGAGAAVVCPAFPTARRTVYSGHLFIDGVPLHETGMRHHPLNPMTDSDLRRWLARQSRSRIAFLPWAEVAQGRERIRAALDEIATEGPVLVVADALTDTDLIELGAALDGAALITGGSGIALGLPANFRKRGLIADAAPAGMLVEGPACVISGSCSMASRAQAAEYAALHPARRIEADEVMTGAVTADLLADWASENAAQSPILYTTADPQAVAAVQGRHGREAVSARIEGLMGDLAVALVARGFKWLAVGGGETSGAVVEALGLKSLRIGAEIAPGVPATFWQSGDQSLGLVLKSGNFGGDGFYETALSALEGK